MSTPGGLSHESLGYLNYLCRVLTQPEGIWEGFYRAQSPAMNFALRYQLAFASYAVAAMSQRTPAYIGLYAHALRGGLERMLDVAAWGYWRAPEPAAPGAGGGRGGLAGSGHLTVLAAPHQGASAGPPSDPVVRDNLQYSGHISTMLGLYEKVSGDRLYDAPFTLHDPESGVSYTYTHSEVAGRIYSQMRENGFGGVCCEQGMAYVPCNNYSLASNALHDALHGTEYSHANSRWLKTVRDKMVLHGPAVRGVFGTGYVKDLHLATPIAFNFTDAWGLAFLLPFDRPLVRKLYGKFKKKVVRTGACAYVASSAISERMEISDMPINTGFGLILARGMGDDRLADALQRYSEEAFGAGWQGGEYFLMGAPRTLQSTALFALAESMELGGESFTRLFHDAPHHSLTPTLEQVDDPSGRVGVFKAEYNAQASALHIGLRRVGDPAALSRLGPAGITLTIAGLTGRPAVEVGGVALSAEELALDGAGMLRFNVRVPPAQDVHCVVHVA